MITRRNRKWGHSLQLEALEGRIALSTVGGMGHHGGQVEVLHRNRQAEVRHNNQGEVQHNNQGEVHRQGNQAEAQQHGGGRDDGNWEPRPIVTNR